MKKTVMQCSHDYFKAADILIYVFIIAVMLCTLYALKTKQGSSVYEIHITYNGETTKYPLNNDAVYFYKNNQIKIEVKNNAVRILESDCPDKICIKMGAIKKPGEIIVCVPNKLIVLIKGINEIYDTVSY